MKPGLDGRYLVFIMNKGKFLMLNGVMRTLLSINIIMVLIIIFCVGNTCGSVSASTLGTSYYVSKNGSDANPGTLSLPWKTISYGVQRIYAGDTLFIRGGIYQEYFSISNDGTSSNPITITNYNGEEVIVDGMNNTLPTRNSGTPLIAVFGDWVNIKNLTVRYSGVNGIYVGGDYVTLDNLYVHHNWNGGVVLSGDHDLIQNSRLWYNSTINEYGQSPYDWSSGVSCARYPDHCTIRKNTVWENWGEGISTFEALYTIMEDNISYDNQQNFYISDTKYTILQRNLSYCTPGNAIDTYHTQNGIYLGDEKGVPIPLGIDGVRYPSSDNTIINNLVVGCNRNLAAGEYVSTNNLYAHNTFVNAAGSTSEPYNVLIASGNAVNARFENNIILQEGDLPIAVFSGTGMTFSNNLWSKVPFSNLIGPGDIIGNPLLTMSDVLAPGQLTPNYFKILPSSPSIDHAKPVLEVFTDYFINIRGNLPDIGAIEESPLILTEKIYLPLLQK